MNFFNSSADLSPGSTCYYLVLAVDKGWWIDVEGKPFGPCEDKDDAIACAFRLIELFGDPTRPAAVYAPDADGRNELIWRGRLDGNSKNRGE